jgi:hypothetical protein
MRMESVDESEVIDVKRCELACYVGDGQRAIYVVAMRSGMRDSQELLLSKWVFAVCSQPYLRPGSTPRSQTFTEGSHS